MTGVEDRVPSAATSTERAEQMLRHDARAALAQARDVLDAAGPTMNTDLDPHTYQRWLLIKGAAQAHIGETEDGARIMREVKAWAEENQDGPLLADTHRRLSALFRRVGDPALMLEHAVTAVDLLDDDAHDAVRADHLLGLADALGASGSFTDSIARYHEARRLAERCGDRYLQLAVLNNLAYTQYEAGLADEAVVTAQRLRAEPPPTGSCSRPTTPTRSRAPTPPPGGTARRPPSSSRSVTRRTTARTATGW